MLVWYIYTYIHIYIFVSFSYSFSPPGSHYVKGCAPGSWSKYAGEQVKHKGYVLGLDLKPVTEHFPPHVELRQGDIFAFQPPSTSDIDKFDVFLSDMAPATTGSKDHDAESSAELYERALDLSLKLLRPPGVLCMKIFQGRSFFLLIQTKKTFKIYARTR